MLSFFQVQSFRQLALVTVTHHKPTSLCYQFRDPVACNANSSNTFFASLCGFGSLTGVSLQGPACVMVPTPIGCFCFLSSSRDFRFSPPSHMLVALTHTVFARAHGSPASPTESLQTPRQSGVHSKWGHKASLKCNAADSALSRA